MHILTTVLLDSDVRGGMTIAIVSWQNQHTSSVAWLGSEHITSGLADHYPYPLSYQAWHPANWFCKGHYKVMWFPDIVKHWSQIKLYHGICINKNNMEIRNKEINWPLCMSGL